MACLYPITGWRSRQIETSGKRKIVFNRAYGFVDQEVKVPCGQCVNCRLDKSRDWAIRCLHEAELHSENCFITLTYNNDHLPKSGTLIKKDYQDFMKRLRKEIQKPIRYFHCGEYGSVRDSNGEVIPGQLGRPHYHAIIFGYQFKDLEIYRIKKGVKLYMSETLERIWGKGFVTVGEVTFESAAYVARYVMKKITGDQSEDHYLKPGNSGEIGPNGELSAVQHEYTTMSRRPGLANKWFQQFSGDLKKDFITHNGKKFKVPKYYDSLFEITDEDHYKMVKAKRKAAAERSETNDPDRRSQIETVKLAQSKMLIREL